MEENYNGLEVAVIGMACKFPKSDNVEEYWKNLVDGKECISFFNEKELINEGISEAELKNPNYVKAKGCIDDIGAFDAKFFGYTPKEAEIMDPQMRLLHQCVYHALEDAGYSQKSENRIGLYLGASANYQWEKKVLMSDELNPEEMYTAWILGDKDFTSTRISYNLDLNGPSYTLDSACSTSLVAIDAAYKAILTGSCEISVAGGVTISLPNKSGYVYNEGGITSPDGHCRPFDINSNGTIAGDGAGVVVLKKLEDAIEDKDNIYAVIKGSAVNNDGIRKVGYTAPSVDGQKDVIESALFMAEVDPKTIKYIETHGTGTALGDVIEIEALNQGYKLDNSVVCKLGSVKSNVGHLNAAAGVASFIKTVLILKNKVIPPSINFTEPNKRINFNNSAFEVNNTLYRFQDSQYPLRAAVSSFGIGGTNAHVILEQAPINVKEEDCDDRDEKLLVVSGKNEDAVRRNIKNILEFIIKNKDIDLTNISYTLQNGRKEFDYRSSIVCGKREELRNILDEINEINVTVNDSKHKDIVFMFTGQGSQYVDMGIELYKNEKYFREIMDTCFKIVESKYGINIKKIVYASEEAVSVYNINDTQIAQLAIFIFEYSLSMQLIKWGIKPDYMIGHSLGEYVAACISGVFSLNDALRLIYVRGKLMQKMPKGDMMSINISEGKLKELIGEYNVSIAAVNEKNNCVVSGTKEAIAEFNTRLDELGYAKVKLNTSHAFHSYMMDPMIDSYLDELRKITFKPIEIPYISNVTGDWIENEEVLSPKYWGEHVRNTVRFYNGINKLLESDNKFFIEIGVGEVLTKLLKKNNNKNKSCYVTNLIKGPRESKCDYKYFLEKVGFIWGNCVEINWEEFNDNRKVGTVSLPGYSFEKADYSKFINKKIKERSKEISGDIDIVKEEIDNYTYLHNWKKVFPIQNSNEKEENYWFILDAQNSMSSNIIEEVKKQNGHLFVNSYSNDIEYEKLNKWIKENNIEVLNIVFNSTDNHDYSSSEALEKQINSNYFRLLNLIKELSRKSITMNLNVITNVAFSIAEDEITNPVNSLLIGLSKVIHQEINNVFVKVIDVNTKFTKNYDLTRLAKLLISEIQEKDKNLIVSYRGYNRYLPENKQSKIESRNGLETVVRENGVYLITGGLGDISLSLCELMAQYKPNLVLLNRSNFVEESSDKFKKLKKIEELGAKVELLSADVSDEAQMKNIFNFIDEKFGRINGVIHAAGIISGDTFKPITEICEEECNRQFETKIYGTYILHKMLEKYDLDFCVLMSSLSSMVGGLGFSAYASANSFLDSFVYYHNAVSNNKWMCINWDGWTLSEGTSQTSSEKLSLTHDEGKKIFNKIMGLNLNGQIIVSTGNLEQRISKWLYNIKEIYSKDSNLENEVQNYDCLSEKIQNIIKDYFGFEKLNLNDNIFDLGATSLDLIQISNTITRKINIPISAVNLYTYPSVAQLVKYIEDQTDKENKEVIDKENYKVETGSRNNLILRKKMMENSDNER